MSGLKFRNDEERELWRAVLVATDAPIFDTGNPVREADAAVRAYRERDEADVRDGRPPTIKELRWAALDPGSAYIADEARLIAEWAKVLRDDDASAANALGRIAARLLAAVDPDPADIAKTMDASTAEALDYARDSVGAPRDDCYNRAVMASAR